MSRAYYNDNDKYCVQWLRNLIDAGLIPNGDVDDRDIRDVKPKDLRGYRQVHFFAGLGGWPYALRLAGWPDDSEVWTGSCPCQPLSVAGQRKGHADKRHLWPAFHRLITELAPPIIFGEQVASKDGREWLAAVRLDLESTGYACGAADLCAAGVGAPHIRQRLWFVAHASRENVRLQSISQRGSEDQAQPGNDGQAQSLAHAHGQGQLQSRGPVSKKRKRPSNGSEALARANGHTWHEGRTSNTPQSEERRKPNRGSGERSNQWAIEPAVGRVAHGIPKRVDKLRALGNAIVPQVAAQFIQAAQEAIKETGTVERPKAN